MATRRWLSVVFFVVLGTHCKGQCGFPGLPRNGSVYVQYNEDKEIDSTDPQKFIPTATYNCKTDHSPLNLGSNLARRCVGGKWTGGIPQCLEIKRLVGYLGADGQPNPNYCQWFSDNVRFYSLEKGRRLYGIDVVASKGYQEDLKQAQWTLRGQEDKSQFETMKIVQIHYIGNNREIQRLIFDNSTIKIKELYYQVNKHIYVCYFGLLIFHDACGHPEIPLHGSVKWNPDDTVATYKCAEDYRLESNSSTRHCVNGQWNGSQPVCAKDASLLGLTSTTFSLFGVCAGLVLLIAVLLLILFKTNRLLRLAERDQAVAALTAELNIAEAPKSSPLYAEINTDPLGAELLEGIRQNRQSRQEWMECNSLNYANIDRVSPSGGMGSNQPEGTSTDFQEPSQSLAVYAQVDKSKKKRNEANNENVYANI